MPCSPKSVPNTSGGIDLPIQEVNAHYASDLVLAQLNLSQFHHTHSFDRSGGVLLSKLAILLGCCLCGYTCC
jgi:hypothetical protein